MSPSKAPSIVNQIVDLLYAEGPMTVKQMCETIKYPYKSVLTKALEIQKLNLATQDVDKVWSLLEGVTPSTLETGERETPRAAGGAEENQEPGPPGAPIVRSPGAPLDQEGLFIQELKNIGVTPTVVIPTIASIFFNGDIDNLSWLNTVLLKSAAGWVNHNKRRLIIDWWSHTRGLPFMPDALFPGGEEEGKARKAAALVAESEPKAEKRLDPGVGWKIQKDGDGDWVMMPGGPMSYQEATDAAKERQIISAYTRVKPDSEPEAGEFGDETGGTRKGGKKAETIMEYMMKKMIDATLDGGKGKASEESETIKRLIERIDSMEKERQEERVERMEGVIAGLASRDPWDDYNRIQEMKDRLGVGGSAVTDQSPAVQLIKDTTDKMDKNVARLVGVIEKAALRSDQFAPETTRTPEQRETKASELLAQVEVRERSRALRKDTFGM